MVAEKALIEQFLEFEKKLKLFKHEGNNIKYWHLIRFGIYSEIEKQKIGLGIGHDSLKGKSILSRIKIKFKQIPNILFNSPFFLKEKEFLILNHQRRVMNENVYTCIYTDNILSSLNDSYLVLEDPLLDTHLKPIPKTNIKYTDYIHNFYLLKRVVKKLKGERLLAELEKIKIREMIKSINNEFSIKLNEEQWVKNVGNALLEYKTMYKHYDKIIKRINPKIIIEVVSYAPSKFVINEIAKRRNIPTVELQHGTMGKYHVAYNFAEKFNLDTFPDYVFLFGKFWQDNTRLPISDSRIKVVGWPYFEQKLNENKEKRKIKKEKVILFISQGTIGNQLSKIALELSKKIDHNQNRIIYKLHPGEYLRWKEEYPWLLGSNIEIVDNNLHDMHYYFAQANVQVGVSSTALFEGIGYGLSTLVYKLPSHKYLEELYLSDLAYLVDDVDELLTYINLDYKNNFNNTNYFWEENSLENIKKALNDILI
ncbi:hypothetical protein [Virgibacillus sp. DJP39]|uniref:hypothetical protein n=1 Tax=Virgibacillus sp. DJP39 TaxID=3409790 RepID=UPI003BB60C47